MFFGKDQTCLCNLEKGQENYKQVNKALMNLEMAEFSMKKNCTGVFHMKFHKVYMDHIILKYSV